MKQWGYIIFVITGVLLMLYGFIRWQYREQKLRDKMLEIEHALKLLDKVHYISGKSKSKAVKEFTEKILKEEDNIASN